MRVSSWRSWRAIPVVVVLALTVAGLGFAFGPWAERGGSSKPTQLGAQVAVTASNTRGERANNSPLLVADPGNPEFVVLSNRLDSPFYACALHVSGDGGKRWTPVNPVPVLPEGTDMCYGPEVGIDAKGRIHFAFLGLFGPGHLPQGMYITTSVDRGRTFSPPRQIHGDNNFGMRMVIDPDHGTQGRIHLVWLHATEPGRGSFGTSDNPILTMHSDDGGETFSQPLRVSEPSRPRSVAPVVTVGSGGRVHVAYYDLLDDARDYQGLEGPVWEGTWQLVVATSTDGGRTFRPGVAAEPEVVPWERILVIFTAAPPSLVASGDRVCVAWTDAREGDADVFSRCSPDRGSKWEPAVRLNDDPVANGRTQYMPRLSIAPNGRIDALYLDRRDDPENLDNDVAYTFSRNGGTTFAGSIRLTLAGKSSSMVGQRYPIPSAGLARFDYGFRIALLSRKSDALAAWTDTHNSPENSKVQDILAISVRPTSAGGGTSLLPLILIAVLVVGGGGSLLWIRRKRSSAPETEPEISDSPVGEAGDVLAVDHTDETAGTHG